MGLFPLQALDRPVTRLSSDMPHSGMGQLSLEQSKACASDVSSQKLTDGRLSAIGGLAQQELCECQV
jgi:hypothetical protein